MILAGLSYLFNSWFSLACITSFPFITLWEPLLATKASSVCQWER